MPDRERALIGMLRTVGSLDLTAILVVVAPREWIASVHQSIGLGEFPREPVAGYLARSTSLWYAIFGLLLWYVSFDVQRHAGLIRLISLSLLIQGFVLAGIDLYEKLPLWWTLMESIGCSGIGCCLFWLQRRSLVVH